MTVPSIDQPLISTGGADFPVHLPPLRPLTVDQAQAAVAGGLSSLLRVLVDLPPDHLAQLGTALRRTAAAMPDTAAAPFRPTYQALSWLTAVVDAHPDAAARLAVHLEEA